MTKFISTVRFTVKDDCVDEFIKREKELDFAGMAEQITLIKTGDTTFCWIGVFESEDAIANCRPKMIQQLDTIRHTLKEISPELGVTDPASGPVIHYWKAEWSSLIYRGRNTSIKILLIDAAPSIISAHNDQNKI